MMRNYLRLYLIFCLLFSCNEDKQSKNLSYEIDAVKSTGVTLTILGTVQDAGSPHIACTKNCCALLFEHPDPTRKVVSLGLLDHEHQRTYLLEATPDITSQVKQLSTLSSWEAKELPDGIFLTHAHIGHYTGLMYLGKEATNANRVPVYAMPKMKRFLSENGPWSQLVGNENIALQPLADHEELSLTNQLKVVPFLVPHRDEYSETVGYKVIGPNKSVLFIPDIDKWEKWETSIIEEIGRVDYAFLDATFYDGEELNTRDISQIPHPFVVESMALFENLAPSEKNKIYFIHFNHTNPLLNPESRQTKEVLDKGFRIARDDMRFEL